MHNASGVHAFDIIWWYGSLWTAPGLIDHWLGWEDTFRLLWHIKIYWGVPWSQTDPNSIHAAIFPDFQKHPKKVQYVKMVPFHLTFESHIVFLFCSNLLLPVQFYICFISNLMVMTKPLTATNNSQPTRRLTWCFERCDSPSAWTPGAAPPPRSSRRPRSPGPRTARFRQAAAWTLCLGITFPVEEEIQAILACHIKNGDPIEEIGSGKLLHRKWPKDAQRIPKNWLSICMVCLQEAWWSFPTHLDHNPSSF